MNKEEVKSSVRDLLREIYNAIDDDFEVRKIKECDHFDEAWLLMMIAAQALRLKEAKEVKA